MAEQAETTEDQRAYPPFVVTPAQRRRWEISRGAAIMICGTNGEPTDNPDSVDVWFWTRGFFSSPYPTDPPQRLAG